MKLLDFQLEPIKHLVSRCRNQHGAFIQFSQGSGKTYIGLFFAKNYPTKKIILICPKGVETGWIALAKKLKIAFYKVIFTANITDLTLIKEVENCIIIVDESHDITDKFVNMQAEIAEKLYYKKKPEKGKGLQKREITVLEKIIDAMKRCHKIIFLSASPLLYMDLSRLAWIFNIVSRQNIFPYHRQEFEKKYLKKDPARAVMKFLRWYQKEKIGQGTGYIASKLLESNSKLTVLTSDKTYMDKGVRYVKTLIDDVSNNLVYQTVYSLKRVADIALNMKVEQLTRTMGVDELDYDKMKVISPYVFYYNYLEHADRDMYPSNQFYELYIPYTPYQLDLFTRYVNGNILTLKEKVLIGLNRNEEEANLFEAIEPRDRVFYKTHALSIGHISGTYKGQLYTPYKYEKFYEIYKKSPLYHIAYSSSVDGCKAFYAFLQSKNIPCVEFTTELKPGLRAKILQHFKNKGNQVVILYPEFYHGISIEGTRHFHILEPIDEYQKFQQLKYRVIRYQSHTHLHKNERNVNIYQYICSLKGVLDVLKMQMLKVKGNYREEGLAHVLLHTEDLLNINYTPDIIFYNDLAFQQTFYDKLNSLMKKISNNKSKLVDTCCVYSDTCPDMFKSCYE